MVTAYLRLLHYPLAILLAAGLLLALASYLALTRFTFDASADTLVVQGDPDVAAYLRVADSFGGDEFLLMTFTPHAGDAFDPASLTMLARMQAELVAVPGVASVFSILDVPLLDNRPLALAELADGLPTLRDADIDVELARAELTGSPVFSELLISRDGRTSAIRIELALDRDLVAVDRERAALRVKQRELVAVGASLPAAQRARLAELDQDNERLRAIYLHQRDALIQTVRAIRSAYADAGILHLGGVPMIASDMIEFVKRDLVLFGSAVVLLVLGMLWWFFRSPRWILLPALCSAMTVVYTMGIIGLVDKPATVISSNFVALLAIMVLSLSIHLIVRHRELEIRQPYQHAAQRVRDTMQSKFAPCLYNTLTTLAAFASLMASEIVPVEDFGWMMCLGIAVGFLVAFTVFPAVLLVLPAGPPPRGSAGNLALTGLLSYLARRQPARVSVVALLWALAAVIGITKVTVDNRFIEYFRTNTDIYQGMYYVDRYLGGTVPFDVIVGFEAHSTVATDDPESFPEDDFADDGDEPFPERYWFTRDKLDRLEQLHAFLEAREPVGKVMSLTALERLARELNGGLPLSGAEIAGVLGLIPEHLRRELIEPYADPRQGLMRLNARIHESGPAFDRAELAREIEQFAAESLGLTGDRVEVTGVMILFDNMLKQLLRSQLTTLMWLLLAVFAMFLILLRSVLYAVLGVIPNVLAAASVIAIMGYAGIPLDMMTITIAAISVGIGVDDAIHYLHRFKEERQRSAGDVHCAVAASHATVGSAMYFTSLAIVVGFSILVLSNFVPTMLFGALTALAMALALLANLTLLPSLLVLVLRSGQRT